MSAIVLGVNLTQRDPTEALVESFFSASASLQNRLIRDDARDVILHFLEENPDGDLDRPFKFIDPSGWTVVVAAGTRNATPTAGTFTLTFTDGTTGAIAYNASAATVQTAIRAVHANLSAATVSGSAGGPYTVDRVTTTAYADPTGSTTALSPTGSSVIVQNTEDGTASLSEKWLITLARRAAIQKASGWSALPSAAVTPTLTTAGSSTVNKTYRVVWNADAYDGAVWLAVLGATGTSQTVGPIDFDATADEVAEMFALHSVIASTDNIGVVQNGPGDYSITFRGTQGLSNVPTIGTSSNTLAVPVGLRGRLDANAAIVHTELNGATSVSVTFEIEINRGSGRETVAISDCIIAADLIRNTPGTSAVADTWLRSTEAFRYIPELAGLQGGGATKLDGQDASLFQKGQAIHFRLGSTVYFYVLIDEGVLPAETSPTSILPDTAVGTKYWRLLFSVADDLVTGFQNFPGRLAVGVTNPIILDETIGVSFANDAQRAASNIGYQNIPQNSQSGNYTLVIGDAGKHIYHASGAGAGDTYTIPANSSVAFPVGTTITFANRDTTNSVSIAITTDTLTMAGTGTTGTRTLAPYGIATAMKITSTEWLISGTGLT